MDLLPLHKQIHKNNGILRENLAHFLSLLFCRPHPSDLKEVARQLEFFALFLSFFLYIFCFVGAVILHLRPSPPLFLSKQQNNLFSCLLMPVYNTRCSSKTRIYEKEKTNGRKNIPTCKIRAVWYTSPVNK
jgi:hypothetical protein